mmetsp:Transcript_41754/g.110011  ORF Transcript_41754/g.110011 Transcript_41754/m.110011 type:complete len:780 (+) Transcript_41754:51-2390(+)
MGEETGQMLYSNLRQLITTVDELRDVGLQKYVNLPRIVVAGTQSSGKSSVLESIIGLDVLPRHAGVCTRRPLELRLVHLDEREHGKDEAFAEFADNPKKFTNFAEVTAEIERLTDSVAGQKKGIVDEPITLTIHATVCPDLTVIDLPGITRVPLKDSAQGDDIEQVTKDMTNRYIEDPRTIILAVMAANQDLSTSDALQMARKADPKGTRTIGVLTKIDIMDRGVDAMRSLRNEEIPLRLGYVGIKNRSQEDIQSKMKVQDALKAEEKWFSEHPKYSKLPPGHAGTRSLVDKLTVVLYAHIKAFLPQICTEIQDKRSKVEQRLRELGDGVPVDPRERTQLMWTLINDYCEMFRNTIRGKHDRRLQMYMHNEDVIAGGCMIRNIFVDFLWELDQTDALEGLSDEEMSNAIRLHEGDSLPGFPSMDTFEFLMLPHLRKIQVPSLECLDRATQTIEQLTQRIAAAVFRRFPKLADQVLNLSKRILSEQQEKTRSIIQNIVDMEMGYLFTNDEGFLVKHGGMESMFEKPPPPPGKAARRDGAPPKSGAAAFEEAEAPPPEKSAFQKASEATSNAWDKTKTALVGPGQPAKPSRKKPQYAKQFIDEIRSRLNSYFKLVVRNVRDAVPKNIGWFLVRATMEKLQFELYTALQDPEQMAKNFGEPPHIMEERKQLMLQKSTLSRSYTVLQKDPVMVNQLSFSFGDLDLDDIQVPPPPPTSQPAQSAPAQAVAARTSARMPQPAARPSPTAATAAPTPMMPRPAAPKAGARSLFDDEDKPALQGPLG